LAQTNIDASVGSIGDSCGNALAETINGLLKIEIIRRHGSWRSQRKSSSCPPVQGTNADPSVAAGCINSALKAGKYTSFKYWIAAAIVSIPSRLMA